MPLLAPYRILDLTNERGLLCGQVFGDLGADVIKIEPPGGSDARRIGPFYQDEPDPDRSLFWWAYNRNKRGITLEYTVEEGRALLLRLVDVLRLPVDLTPLKDEAAEFEQKVNEAVAKDPQLSAYVRELKRREFAN